MAGLVRSIKKFFSRVGSKAADEKREKENKEEEKKVELHQSEDTTQEKGINGRLGVREDDVAMDQVNQEWRMMFGDQLSSLDDSDPAEGIEEAEEAKEIEEAEETAPNFIIGSINPDDSYVPEMEETGPESLEENNNAVSCYGFKNTEETEFATLFREYISACLKQRECMHLFREVLKTRDSERLMLLCDEALEYHVLDLTSPVLTQPLIFSLIHHLSLDLADNTTLRLKYLDDALMALDTTSELYEQDGRPLLLNLCHNLRAFLREHPEHSGNTEFLRNTCTELMRRT